MNKIITSRQFVELFISILLNGKSSKIGMEIDGEFTMKHSQILTQYLNLNMRAKIDKKNKSTERVRTKMTKGIADALIDTAKYIITSTKPEYKNAFIKMVLFIYSISGVDVTYINSINGSERNNVLTDFLEKIVRLFQGKEYVEHQTVYELVYGFTPFHELNTEQLVYISEKTYLYALSNRMDGVKGRIALNILQGHIKQLTVLHKVRYPKIPVIIDPFILDSNKRKQRLRLYRQRKLDDLLNEEYNQEVKIEKMSEIWDLILNLLLPASDYKSFHEQLTHEDTIDDFPQKINMLTRISDYDAFKEKCESQCSRFFSPAEWNDKNMWKAVIFTYIYESIFFWRGYRIPEGVQRMFPQMILYNPKSFIVLQSILSNVNIMIQSNEQENKKPANKKLYAHISFNSFRQYVNDYLSFVEFQIRMRLDYGSLGRFNPDFGTENNQPANLRSYIRSMVDCLFKGHTNVIGKMDDINGRYYLSKSSIIENYLNGHQNTFSEKLRDALFYQAKYYLYPDLRLKEPKKEISSEIFMDILWQFFYCVFDVDFYMLRNDTSHNQIEIIKCWEKMLNRLLTVAVIDADMTIQRKMVEHFYFQYQIELDGKQIQRFRSNEISFCCEQEANINLLRNPENRIVFKYIPRYGDLIYEAVYRHNLEELKSLIERINTSFTFLKQLMNAQSVQEAMALVQISNAYFNPFFTPVNWKHEIYSNATITGNVKLKDPMQIASEEHRKNSLPLEDIRNLNRNNMSMLNSYFEFIVMRYGHYIFETPMKEDIRQLQEDLWGVMIRISNLYDNFYSEIEKMYASGRAIERIDEQQLKNVIFNLELLHTNTVGMVYQAVRNAYLYILYQQRVDYKLRIK